MGLKLLMWIILLIVDEKGVNYFLKFVADFHLHAITDELVHRITLTDITREFASKLIV